MLKFFVSDTGVGIEPKHHGLIFERFRQVQMDSTRKYGGTGLGLPICKALLEMMNGTIWVESELGKGATFFFTIPNVPVEVAQPKPIEHGESFNFSGKTILIAEDEEANFLYISELIDETGAAIIHATDGRKAIEAVQANPNINIILMDIKMPEITGIEATKILRQRNVDIPIVALTAYAMTGDKEICLAAGCNAYLSKPVRRIELLNTIAEYL